MGSRVDGVLVTGAGGQLGSVLMPLALAQGRRVWGTVSPRGLCTPGQALVAVDLREPTTLIERALETPPAAIIHLAAVSSLGDAYRDPIRAHEVNVEATGELAALAARLDARFVYASTDMVFDGHGAPYVESDTPLPTSSYGRTKLAGESHVLRYSNAVVVRLPLLYGIPPVAPERSHLWRLAQSDLAGPRAALFEDEYRTPLCLADAAEALLRIADEAELNGVVHLAGRERISRAELGTRWAAALGRELPIEPVKAAEQRFDEPRPPDLSMNASRYLARFGTHPGRPLDEALAAWAHTVMRA